MLAAAAAVTVIDTRTFQTATVRLITGTTSAPGIVVTPDGQYALLVHVLARYHLPATRVDGGWICVSHAGTHELSVIDAAALLST